MNIDPNALSEVAAAIMLAITTGTFEHIGGRGADQALSAGGRLLQRLRARRGNNEDPASAQELEKELAALLDEQPITLREFELFRRELAAQPSLTKVQVTSIGDHAVFHRPTFGFVESP